jgi:hypothetical protein
MRSSISFPRKGAARHDLPRTRQQVERVGEIQTLKDLVLGETSKEGFKNASRKEHAGANRRSHRPEPGCLDPLTAATSMNRHAAGALVGISNSAQGLTSLLPTRRLSQM